jgi:TorA maturation chaperone TorD
VRFLEPGKNLVDQLVEANRGRGNVYSFLSKIYEKEVTVDLLKQLTRPEFVSQLNTMGEGEGFNLLSSYLKSAAGRDLQQIRLELAVEYAKLFLGLGAGIYHPSESAYTTSTHFIMQQPRDSVMAEYRKALVDKVKGFPEPEDHVAMELQFMAHLCGKTEEAVKSGQNVDAKNLLESQRNFMNNHLMIWVPKFAADVIKATTVDFYKAIAQITAGFLEVDKEAIRDLIKELENP